MSWHEWYYVVNPLSGGRQGWQVARALRKLVAAERVWDLFHSDLPMLFECCRARRTPLIVVGGDGTATSVLNTLATHAWPVPIGVLPLGTGNDLARFLGMPGIAIARLPHLLQRMSHFTPQRLDRWRLEGPGLDLWWYNYCTFGTDARICHGFDLLRRRHPRLFHSALVNKLWYGVLGLLDRRRRVSRILDSPLFPGSQRRFESLVFANIASYAGGTCLSPAIDAADGRLDALVLPGGMAMAPYLRQWRQAPQIAQTTGTWIGLRRPSHIQVDGEPYRCRAGVYRISYGGQVPVLARRASVTSMGLHETERAPCAIPC